jgi:hypothetical protein
MVLAVPGGRGLFSVLQQVLKVRSEDGTRARLSMEVHAILQDVRSLARDLQNRPTRIAELIPADTPATIGAQDAVGTGMEMAPSHHCCGDQLFRPPCNPV